MDQQPSPIIQQEQPNLQPQKPLSKTWQIAALVVAGILVIGGVSYSSYYLWQKSTGEISQKACTQDAQQCADGSYVSRTGPNCEFAQCPSASATPSATPDQTANWQTYKDNKYGFEFKYPNDWNSAGNSSNDPDAYNITIWKGDGINKDNIQTVKVFYGINADGSTNNRESYLKMLTSASNGYSKVSIAGGQGYYDINETKGGPSPEIYLVGDREIFLMNYNIFDSSISDISEAEELLKQIVGTFKFIDEIATNLGPMPQMTYKILKDECVQNNEHSDIAFYADGKQVTIFSSAFCDIDKVVFRAGNSSLVYFSILPSGIGGYYIYLPAFNLYKLDLNKKTAERIIDQLNSFDFNSSLTKIIYVSSAQIIVMDLATGAQEYFGKIPSSNDSYQIGNVKFSPDLKKAAVAVGYGPTNEYGEIYILDFLTKTYTLYKQTSSGHLQVNGWKSNTEVNWSNI